MKTFQQCNQYFSNLLTKFLCFDVWSIKPFTVLSFSLKQEGQMTHSKQKYTLSLIFFKLPNLKNCSRSPKTNEILYGWWLRIQIIICRVSKISFKHLRKCQLTEFCQDQNNTKVTKKNEVFDYINIRNHHTNLNST